MTLHHPATRSSTPPSPRWDGLRRLVLRRSVLLTLAGWVAAHLLLLALAGDHLPFHATSLAEPPPLISVLRTDAMVLEVLALMGVVHLLTRRRTVPDVTARAPAVPQSGREVAGLLAYGAAALLGGLLLGRSLGWHAMSLHLDSMVIRTGHDVVPAEALTWAAYNLLVFVVVPFAWFRRRYTGEQLGLRSADRRADTVLVLVVLALESTVQLTLTAGPASWTSPGARRSSALL